MPTLVGGNCRLGWFYSHMKDLERTAGGTAWYRTLGEEGWQLAQLRTHHVSKYVTIDSPGLKQRILTLRSSATNGKQNTDAHPSSTEIWVRDITAIARAISVVSMTRLSGALAEGQEDPSRFTLRFAASVKTSSSYALASRIDVAPSLARCSSSLRIPSLKVATRKGRLRRLVSVVLAIPAPHAPRATALKKQDPSPVVSRA